jgi:hypothetical protein
VSTNCCAYPCKSVDSFIALISSTLSLPMDPTSCHSGNGTRPVNTGLLYIQAVSRADVAQQRAKTVELFLFFWQMRLLLSCCRSVNQEACLGFVWSGTRSGCTINHYQFSSSSFFLFFSFLFFCRSERASSSQHVFAFLFGPSSGRDVSDWLPLPRTSRMPTRRTGPPFVQLLWPCPKTEPVRLRLLFLLQGIVYPRQATVDGLVLDDCFSLKRHKGCYPTPH